jgi:hypothetical protein
MKERRIEVFPDDLFAGLQNLLDAQRTKGKP